MMENKTRFTVDTRYACHGIFDNEAPLGTRKHMSDYSVICGRLNTLHKENQRLKEELRKCTKK